MKKILILLFLFTQLVAYAQLVGTPYILQPSSTNGTAVVSAYTCINDFNPGSPFNSIAGGVLKVGTNVLDLGSPPTPEVKQSITATVTKIGTWNITTTTANGVTFSGSGTFTQTGNQTIQLTATGTPILKGNNTFTINTTPNCGCIRYSSVTGVYASVNGTLRDFGTHNLGADTNLDPKTYVEGNADGSGGTLGYIYQWGRQTDGHERRNSATSILDGPFTAPLVDTFIKSGGSNWLSPNDNTLWGGTTKGPKDPCPDGFRVPTRQEYLNLFRVPNNTQTWNGTNPLVAPNQNSWTFIAANRGYMVGPLLFLPAAGYRNQAGGLYSVSLDGNYWLSTSRAGNAAQANTIFFNQNGFLDLREANARSNKIQGNSVRCIATE